MAGRKQVSIRRPEMVVSFSVDCSTDNNGKTGQRAVWTKRISRSEHKTEAAQAAVLRPNPSCLLRIMAWMGDTKILSCGEPGVESVSIHARFEMVTAITENDGYGESVKLSSVRNSDP